MAVVDWHGAIDAGVKLWMFDRARFDKLASEVHEMWDDIHRLEDWIRKLERTGLPEGHCASECSHGERLDKLEKWARVHIAGHEKERADG